MATTATKTEHSNSNTASHSTASHTGAHKTATHTGAHKTASTGAHKTASKTKGKRRGGYSFGHTASSTGAHKTTASAKGTRRGGASAKGKSGARGSHSGGSHSTSHSTTSRGTGNSRSGLDLGFASIAKSASDASRQNAASFSNAANRGSNALNGAFANVATNAKQVQDKVSNFGRGVSENLKQTASRAAESANQSLEMHRANAEALGQSYNVAQSAIKEASQEIFSFFNDTFTQNVEAARQALECRNIGEFFQIHNDRVRQNLESAFEQAIRMSEIAIETATEAFEPINQSVTKNSRKYSQKYNA